MTPALLRRVAAHEAAHIVMEVLHFGPEKVFATTWTIGGMSGAMVKWRGEDRVATYTEHLEAPSRSF